MRFKYIIIQYIKIHIYLLQSEHLILCDIMQGIRLHAHLMLQLCSLKVYLQNLIFFFNISPLSIIEY